MGNFAEMYSNVLRQQLVDDQTEQGAREPGDAETFEEEDMEIATSKRGRESSTSPVETKEQKKEKGRGVTAAVASHSVSTGETTYAAPPPPPPRPRPPVVRPKKEKESSQDMAEEISKKVQEERLRLREHSHSQSSVSSTASGGQDIRSAKEMVITIHVPNTETNRRIFSTPLNKEKKEAPGQITDEGQCEINLGTIVCKERDPALGNSKKTSTIGHVRFRMTSMEEYMHLSEGSRKAKTTP